MKAAVGLMLVIVGAIASFTCVGMIIGIPMILFGGTMLFNKD